MIARVWRGYTKPVHADAYESMLKPELLPGLSTVRGFRGSYLLRRPNGSEVEFMTIILWDSLDDVRAIAGETLRDRGDSGGTTKIPRALRRRGGTLRGRS